jgi:hypothetical protein
MQVVFAWNKRQLHLENNMPAEWIKLFLAGAV